MRPFKFIILLLLAACFLGFKTWTNKVYIKGHIRKNPNDTPAFVSYLAVFVKGDNKVLAKR
jgi:hypothetical protein